MAPKPSRKASKAKALDPLDVLRESLEQIRAMQARLKVEMNRTALQEKFYDSNLASQAAMLGRASATVAKEWRAVEKQARVSAQTMSAAEKRRVFAGYFAGLPGRQQHELLEELKRLYEEKKT